jgi:hypothetical protein
MPRRISRLACFVVSQIQRGGLRPEKPTGKRFGRMRRLTESTAPLAQGTFPNTDQTLACS